MTKNSNQGGGPALIISEKKIKLSALSGDNVKSGFVQKSQKVQLFPPNSTVETLKADVIDIRYVIGPPQNATFKLLGAFLASLLYVIRRKSDTSTIVWHYVHTVTGLTLGEGTSRMCLYT